MPAVSVGIVNGKLSRDGRLCRNSYISSLTENEVLSYILRSISEGKNEDEIADRCNGDTELVRTWLNTLKQMHFVKINYFDELVIIQDGVNYLEKFNSHRYSISAICNN
jgi:DNA-binding CsgD family transcriptional regulator